MNKQVVNKIKRDAVMVMVQKMSLKWGYVCVELIILARNVKYGIRPQSELESGRPVACRSFVSRLEFVCFNELTCL